MPEQRSVPDPAREALDALPDGAVVAGPVREREETLIAELDLDMVAAHRRHMDPTGHYNRPDVFRLHVDTRARRPVVETTEDSEWDPRNEA